MKSAIIFFINIFLVLTDCTTSFAQTASNSVVFVASTPCDKVSKSLLQIPAGEKCDWMKWKLELKQDGSYTYQLNIQYGTPRQGSRDFEKSRTMEWKGVWGIDPTTAIYNLYAERPKRSLSFLQLDPNVLHLLDANKHLVPGNGGFGYLLNRVNPVPVASTKMMMQPAFLPKDNNASLLEIYSGRTPCNHIVRTISNIDPSLCQITKWRVTFYQDSINHTPSHYKLETLYVGTGNDFHINTGKWSISRGIENNPNAIVYQLQLDRANPSSTLNFLKVDDNTLFLLDKNNNFSVGDDYASYAISKVSLRPNR